MEKRTSILVIAMLLLSSAVFLKAGPTVQASGVNDGSSPGSYYGGTVDTGGYIRAGINDYGVLGVSNVGDDGFQYPIGSDYESLAVGGWFDCWSVFYGLAAADFKAGFNPDDDAWGTISGVTPTVTSTATSYGYLHTITMTTSDGQVELTFKVEFFSNEKYLKIEAYIKNVGTSAITDLEYKRCVDWDVWEPINPSYYTNPAK